MIRKVHRVCTVEEARHFEALGADLVGVSMAEDDHFIDHRTLSASFAAEIGQRIERAEFVLEPPRDMNGASLVDLVRQTGARWIQTPIFSPPDGEAREDLRRAGIGLIISRVDADYDMDPDWILGPVRDLGEPWPDLVELEVIPSFSESWRFLTEQSPQQPDELQIEDLECLARQSALLLSIDYTPHNINEIQRRIPSARGKSFTLGMLAGGVSGLHVFTPEDVAALLGEPSESSP